MTVNYLKMDSTTSRVTNIACPMCREPVTLGGGIGITKGLPPLSKFGLKYPCDSHLKFPNPKYHQNDHKNHMFPSYIAISKLHNSNIISRIKYHLYIFSSEEKSKVLEVSGEVKTLFPDAATEYKRGIPVNFLLKLKGGSCREHTNKQLVIIMNIHKNFDNNLVVNYRFKGNYKQSDIESSSRKQT